MIYFVHLGILYNGDIMKENNEAMLFVNSISVYRAPSIKTQSHKLHRLDDIKALLKFNKKVILELISFNNTYIGEVKELNDKELILIIEEKEKTIYLDSISMIKIINTK